MISETLKKQIEAEQWEFMNLYGRIGEFVEAEEEDGAEFTDIRHNAVQALMNWRAAFGGDWNEMVLEFLSDFMAEIENLKKQGFPPPADGEEPAFFNTRELTDASDVAALNNMLNLETPSAGGVE